MEKEDYMTRNEWLVQFIFTLMVVLVAGMVIDYAARFASPGASPDQQQILGAVRLLAPTPLPAANDSPSALGILLAFVYTMAIIFLMGVLKPPRKKRKAPVSARF